MLKLPISKMYYKKILFEVYKNDKVWWFDSPFEITKNTVGKIYMICVTTLS